MRIVLFIVISHLFCNVFASNISGVVYDSATKEVLIGAVVWNKTANKFYISDSYGRFSVVSLNDSPQEIEVSYVGYQKSISFHMPNSFVVLNLVRDLEIDEVNVCADRVHDKSKSAFTLSSKDLSSLPALFGEKDLATMLQMVPGVHLNGEGSTSLYVRGGSDDQNLYMIDEIPLYHVNHIDGFISTFNGDIIKNATLHKGAFPAKYGGRLSSVLDINTKDGDMKNYSGNVQLGPLMVKGVFEGPIIKEKTSFIVSARKNALPIFKMMGTPISLNFYDVNVKLNHLISDKKRIYFSFYNGNDAIGIKIKPKRAIDENYEMKHKIGWGNIAGAIRYNQILSNNLFMNITTGTTLYRYYENSLSEMTSTSSDDYSKTSRKLNSSIGTQFLKLHFNYSFLTFYNFQLGYDYSYHTFVPGTINMSKETPSSNFNYSGSFDNHNIHDNSVYGEISIKNNDYINFNAGLRANQLTTVDKTYNLLQPRISLAVSVGDYNYLKGAFSKMNQFYHLLSNIGTGIPIEYRIPAMEYAPPSASTLYSIGSESYVSGGEFVLEIELYKKYLSNLVDFLDGVDYITNVSQPWNQIIANNGTGQSKGVEILLRKPKGSTTGWVRASLSNTIRQFDLINGGKPYTYKYDRLFSFSILLSEQISEKISLSATWVLGTGNALTLPIEWYKDHLDNTILVYSERNGYREQPYHRLDIGMTYIRNPLNKKSVWTFAIINVYARKNPYFYFMELYSNGNPKVMKQSLYPFLPTLSYQYNF